MSAFTSARMIEAKGLAILEPFIREHAYNGQVVWTTRGDLSKSIQESMGDVLFNTDKDKIWAVEIKIEQEHTGNLFIETWSNKNLNNEQSHADRGCNPGWLYKLRADLLMYYFLDTDDLYVIDVYPLKRWAFCGGPDGGGNIWAYREVPQGRYSQANDTWGRLVPVEDLKRMHIIVRHHKPLTMRTHITEVAAE